MTAGTFCIGTYYSNPQLVTSQWAFPASQPAAAPPQYAPPPQAYGAQPSYVAPHPQQPSYQQSGYDAQLYAGPPATLNSAPPASLPNADLHGDMLRSTKFVPIPTARIGAVVGPKGAVLRHISEQSGCKVVLPRPGPGQKHEGDVYIELTGTEPCLAVAEHIVADILRS